jgi:hypothetical protein
MSLSWLANWGKEGGKRGGATVKQKQAGALFRWLIRSQISGNLHGIALRKSSSRSGIPLVLAPEMFLMIDGNV